MQVNACPHEQAAEVFKAVSDPTRLRILALLAHAGELCGCEVEATLGITQTRASRALTTLRRAGLVVDRREGAWVHYSLPTRPAGLLASVLQGLRKSLEDDPVVLADRAHLKRLC